MLKRKILIATRNSPLALWQANYVKNKLTAIWPKLSIKLFPMTTSGDKWQDAKLLQLGGKGLFIKELEEALLDKRADLAVHSMKDVPAEFPEGLTLKAICERASPFDALISNNNIKLNSLPKDAKIGTSSLRRQSQLLALRPDFNIQFIRGNINTRIEKLERSEFDAIILAVSGIMRLELDSLITEKLSPEIMLPACGQGAIGIECRSDDFELHQYITKINDPITAICVNSERKVTALLGANCRAPVAVYCESLEHNKLTIHGKVCNSNGTKIIYNNQQGKTDDALNLAEKCAQSLLQQGAFELIQSSM